MPVFFYNSLKNKPKQPFQPHLYLSLSFCARYMYENTKHNNTQEGEINFISPSCIQI